MEENKKPENPNAFPNINTNERSGMTLRDYFANSIDGLKVSEGYSIAFAEEILNRKLPKDNKTELVCFWFEFESKLQYMKADAMLKQREL